ncbi:MAG: V-type ATP synthase subunit A [Candidatus Omnitrophota bacterium]|nr:MAG: V-type ATP synthase subunit A [Candidatus Omnitrophota bacterium]
MAKPMIVRVSGPLVVAKNCLGAKMYDVVKVGKAGLTGEIIELKEDLAFIQVYEETAGIGPGEPIVLTHMPLSVELGPGLLGKIFDGTQRPLETIYTDKGNFIMRGIDLPSLEREKRWEFKPVKEEGAIVEEGDLLGEVQETELVSHKILVPPGVSGKVTKINQGEFRIEDIICVIEKDGKKHELKLFQTWPVRKSRPFKRRVMPTEILSTGQRVIDAFFPVAKGGTACVPGPFGSGKTVVQHQLAKWSDAQIIVYVACGERGNETADLLLSFPELKDPHSGRPLMERTVIIANTSNMPVAAREASIYTGITIAEYFRDQGYSVALMADSTSRWAEALREISGRMEEMPGEEGYPAYLPARLAEFYERAGQIECLGSQARRGALSVIGAVSPPGGDLSDPVVQATLKVVKVFWGLDDRLANARHFPAINWLISYSLYHEPLEDFKREKIAETFEELRSQGMRLLEEEEELKEIARLVGMEALNDEEKLKLEVARSIREDFLHQNAFHPEDTFTSLKQQHLMLELILDFYQSSLDALRKEKELNKILKLPVRLEISRAKFIPEDQLDKFTQIKERIAQEIDNV